MHNPFRNDPHPDLTAAIRAVTEGKTLSKREMGALKTANAADLKEYPGKRGEAAHKRLHKVIKSVTEAQMTKGRKAILDAEIVKNIKKGSGRTEADAHRMRRVALSGLRMSGGGRIGNVEAQAAAREAERKARKSEKPVNEGALSGSTASLHKKYQKYNNSIIGAQEFPPPGEKNVPEYLLSKKKQNWFRRRRAARSLAATELVRRGEKLPRDN